MDRLTTGRRRRRTGSVSVTELLTKQASPAHCTDSSRPEPGDRPDDSTDIIPVVLVPASHRRTSAMGGQFAKLATLGVAGVVLCGAVTISSVISHQRRENAQETDRPTTQITGQRALLPDQLNETSAVPAAPPRSASPVAEKRPAPPAPAHPQPTRAPAPGGTTASAGTRDAEPAPATDLALVREFYEKLPGSPAAAFGLLASEQLHTSFREFLAAWSKVTRIESVDVVQRADGVLATVRMRLHDGSHLRLQQLLTVAESPRRIVGVQLLSAQLN